MKIFHAYAAGNVPRHEEYGDYEQRSKLQLNSIIRKRTMDCRSYDERNTVIQFDYQNYVA